MAERCRRLQAESPDDLRVLAESARGYLERRVHAALHASRLHGDWFSPAVAASIRAGLVGPGGFDAWLDALLGPRALVEACACGSPVRPGALTCCAAACVRAAKGRRTPRAA